MQFFSHLQANGLVAHSSQHQLCFGPPSPPFPHKHRPDPPSVRSPWGGPVAPNKVRVWDVLSACLPLFPRSLLRALAGTMLAAGNVQPPELRKFSFYLKWLPCPHTLGFSSQYFSSFLNATLFGGFLCCTPPSLHTVGDQSTLPE